MTRTVSTAGPTLAVVAREAGVSVPTASKVVNGRDDVAPETRRRVTEVLDRLGYVRRRRTGPPKPHGMVDLVLSALDGSGAAVLHGVERAAHAEGLEVVVSAGRHLGQERLDRLAARGTAGILFHGDGLTPAQHAWLNRHRVPYVLIDPEQEPSPGSVSVGAADRQGGRAAAGHLLALGHDRIALVDGHAPGHVQCAWRAGWHEALAAAGLPHRPEYVRRTGPDEPEEYGARRRTLELLDLPEPPTAVCVCSDAMAPGVYGALAERGLRVPDDVAVVGFGDLPEARWAVPGLTTVRRPLAEMAGAALALLVRLAAGEPTDGLPVELATELVVRSSTAPPPSTGAGVVGRASRRGRGPGGRRARAAGAAGGQRYAAEAW
ncbi:LacI family DNA-binding transcriptional regulator [Streptomyces sp. TRM76323]|uniref:LacI family DNA-binding transcriptional regulator n=1 Tax=Streptomyces tamarix TaxID=3078565 RepID=A0ABU3QV89_9ACTN|nr:LacI family DNA-binding transcriptional regulator [Streptomyces tamarix]MDT9686667.1 LacI family DNA-binding transcriptional regulator [Streptomyces tamarix]